MFGSRASTGLFIGAVLAFVPSGGLHAARGEVLGHQKISDTAGGFGGLLDNVDLFGASVARLGDWNGFSK